ncbi:MAG: MerR family transcriptional regulator [Alphaproteobacteria bacterium]|nr:MerR family transcriptional regulator [Alphaproteobacteria bacterium]
MQENYEQVASKKQLEKRQVKSKKSSSAFRTISEVAEHLNVQQHVLRFWETKFSYVRPLKRGGGRRYYRPEDVNLLESIHHLLYTEGYTIKGVQKLLKDKGKNGVVQNNAPISRSSGSSGSSKVSSVQDLKIPANALGARNKFLLESVLGDLEDLRALLTAV